MTFDPILARMVKQVCTGHGVSIITLSSYRTFARQVDKTRKHASGSDLYVVVAALVERYVKLGLERKVLTDIAFHVFNVAVPIAP